MRSHPLPPLAFVLLLCPLSLAQSPSANPAAIEPLPRSAALKALLDEHVEWLKRESPEESSTRGDERFNDQLYDTSPAATQHRLGELKDRLLRANALDAAAFSDAERLDLDLLRFELTRAVDGAPFHREQLPIDALSGPHIWLPQLCDRIPFRTDKHYADYATRLEAVPASIDGTIAQMRLGLQAGRVPPKAVLANTLERIRVQTAFAGDAEHSPFYRPYLTRPTGDASAARARIAIGELVIPAFQRLAEFVEKEYLPRCRDTIGASEGIDGPDAYAYLLRMHTTLDLTPQQVHEIGLREVASLREQMMRVIAETGFTASGPNGDALRGAELFAAFLAHVRTDASFKFTSADDMLRAYRDLTKRVDPELPRLFGRLPRNTYGVRAIPDFAGPASPAAYYYPGSLRSGVPGYFMVNTSSLDRRTTYGMISLTLHESVPGHHFQIQLADEIRFAESEGAGSGASLHEFRSYLDYSSYVEGWALYCERLGLEMGEKPRQAGGRGFYANPYDEFGRLSDEMWRACRLVVDTGIHALDWSRERAVQYLLENSAVMPEDIEREVDRYIGWPGQACAYKLGQLKILELRERAERELGDRFDIRAFHDEILLGGALPLPVLDARITRWIERQTVRAP